MQEVLQNKVMEFRIAVQADAERIWEIILQAKEQMRLRGTLQWQDGYPAFENITQDIENGYGYVLSNHDGVVAYGAVVFDGEPAYDAIVGEWLTNQPYVVVHRLAVAGEMKQQGIATLFMQEVEKLSRERGVHSFKVDTNFDNLYMQRIMSKLGFSYCGEVEYRSGKRMAYEKVC